MLVIAESGQKHIVFRARVAHDRSFYPVQMEEQTIYVVRDELAACFEAFEALLAMGFTRDEVASGRYSQNRLMKSDREAWRRADARMDAFRETHPDWVRLVHLAAHGPRKESG